MCMVDSKENYNFDVRVKGLTNVIYLNIDKWLSDSDSVTGHYTLL